RAPATSVGVTIVAPLLAGGSLRSPPANFLCPAGAEFVTVFMKSWTQYLIPHAPARMQAKPELLRCGSGLPQVGRAPDGRRSSPSEIRQLYRAASLLGRSRPDRTLRQRRLPPPGPYCRYTSIPRVGLRTR